MLNTQRSAVKCHRSLVTSAFADLWWQVSRLQIFSTSQPLNPAALRQSTCREHYRCTSGSV